MDEDLVLDIAGAGDRVTVPNWFADGDVSAVLFHDGSRLGAADIRKLAVEREPDITFVPISLDKYIVGTDGNDSLVADGSRSVMFVPGKGDDQVLAGNCDSVVYYRNGEGHDTITVDRKKGHMTVLRFHDDIVSADVSVERRESDLLLSISDGSVTVKGYYNDPASKIDRIEFFGGDVWDGRDLEKLASGKALTARSMHIVKPEEASMGEDAQDENGKPSKTSSGGGSSGCDMGAFALIALACAAMAGLRVRRIGR